MDDGYGRLIHRALHHRPTVLGIGTALTVAAVLILPTIGFELMPQADEGEVQVTAELPVGTRIERAEEVALRLESLAEGVRAGSGDVFTQAGGGGGFGGGGGWRRRRQPDQHDDPADARRTSASGRANRSRAT